MPPRTPLPRTSPLRTPPSVGQAPAPGRDAAARTPASHKFVCSE